LFTLSFFSYASNAKFCMKLSVQGAEVKTTTCEIYQYLTWENNQSFWRCLALDEAVVTFSVDANVGYDYDRRMAFSSYPITDHSIFTFLFQPVLHIEALPRTNAEIKIFYSEKNPIYANKEFVFETQDGKFYQLMLENLGYAKKCW